MSISSLIGPQIPLLRRYARVLSGSRESGDAYVAALLETLLADPGSFDCAAEPREETYRLFSRVWNAVPINGEGKDGARDLGASELGGPGENGAGDGRAAKASVPDRRLEA